MLRWLKATAIMFAVAVSAVATIVIGAFIGTVVLFLIAVAIVSFVLWVIWIIYWEHRNEGS